LTGKDIVSIVNINIRIAEFDGKRFGICIFKSFEKTINDLLFLLLLEIQGASRSSF